MHVATLLVRLASFQPTAGLGDRATLQPAASASTWLFACVGTQPWLTTEVIRWGVQLDT